MAFDRALPQRPKLAFAVVPLRRGFLTVAVRARGPEVAARMVVAAPDVVDLVGRAKTAPVPDLAEPASIPEDPGPDPRPIGRKPVLPPRRSPTADRQPFHPFKGTNAFGRWSEPAPAGSCNRRLRTTK